MATPTVPVYDYSHAEPSLADYTSMMLKMYFENLSQSALAEILDVGPVCEENITYFAKRVKRFHVCDMFIRLYRNQRKGGSTKKIWEHLDYEPHRFDGINVWHLIDHLNDNQMVRLVNLCHTLLKPKGMMIITSFEEQWAPSQVHSFVIKDCDRVTFRLQSHLKLPRYYHSNRIITDRLSKFSTVKSFIYRNGVREFLCRRD